MTTVKRPHDPITTSPDPSMSATLIHIVEHGNKCIRTLIPLTYLEWPSLDIPQQIHEVVDMRFRPFAIQQGFVNFGELIVDGAVVVFDLGDCSCDEGLVIIVVADGVKELLYDGYGSMLYSLGAAYSGGCFCICPRNGSIRQALGW